jgi:hypothetical protein
MVGKTVAVTSQITVIVKIKGNITYEVLSLRFA